MRPRQVWSICAGQIVQSAFAHTEFRYRLGMDLDGGFLLTKGLTESQPERLGIVAPLGNVSRIGNLHLVCESWQ